jgi:hypothetical protein
MDKRSVVFRSSTTKTVKYYTPIISITFISNTESTLTYLLTYLLTPWCRTLYEKLNLHRKKIQHCCKAVKTFVTDRKGKLQRITL